jgi:hypothetical protein
VNQSPKLPEQIHSNHTRTETEPVSVTGSNISNCTAATISNVTLTPDGQLLVIRPQGVITNDNLTVALPDTSLSPFSIIQSLMASPHQPTATTNQVVVDKGTATNKKFHHHPNYHRYQPVPTTTQTTYHHIQPVALPTSLQHQQHQGEHVVATTPQVQSRPRKVPGGSKVGGGGSGASRTTPPPVSPSNTPLSSALASKRQFTEEESPCDNDLYLTKKQRKYNPELYRKDGQYKVYFIIYIYIYINSSVASSIRGHCKKMRFAKSDKLIFYIFLN